MSDDVAAAVRDASERLRDAALSGDPCAALPGVAFAPKRPRSPGWRALRESHLGRHPACLACGRTARLEVHHVRPFHLFPELELEEGNLMTLCEAGPGGMSCHHLVGHGGNWADYIADPAKYARAMLRMIEGRVRG